MPIIPLGVALDMGRGDKDEADYRRVPASDRGNDGYRDRGGLGGYQTNDGEPFAPPSDVRFLDGYGASMADLERGWCEPLITEHPAYQEANYRDRYSQPRESDVTPGNVDAQPSDWEFRMRQRESKGFLPRHRVPVDRG